MKAQVLHQLRDPVFSISGMINSDLQNELTKIVLNAPDLSFRSQRSFSRTIDHHEDFGKKIFENSAVKELAKMATSEIFINFINVLLQDSNSYFAKKRNPHISPPVSSGTLIDNTSIPEIESRCLRTVDSNELDKWAPVDGFIPLWHSSVYNDLSDKEKFFKSWHQGEVNDVDMASIIFSYVCAFRKIPVIPKMTFTKGYKGMHLPPHTDAQDKLASIMLYLPINEKQKQADLGTIFWSKHNGYQKQHPPKILESNSEEYINFINSHSKERAPFEGGDLICFFKSETSWHSFEYDGEDVGPRCAILINFLTPKILWSFDKIKMACKTL